MNKNIVILLSFSIMFPWNLMGQQLRKEERQDQKTKKQNPEEEDTNQSKTLKKKTPTLTKNIKSTTKQTEIPSSIGLPKKPSTETKKSKKKWEIKMKSRIIIMGVWFVTFFFIGPRLQPYLIALFTPKNLVLSQKKQVFAILNHIKTEPIKDNLTLEKKTEWEPLVESMKKKYPQLSLFSSNNGINLSGLEDYEKGKFLYWVDIMKHPNNGIDLYLSIIHGLINEFKISKDLAFFVMVSKILDVTNPLEFNKYVTIVKKTETISFQ
jgi:hypothetical protein